MVRIAPLVLIMLLIPLASFAAPTYVARERERMPHDIEAFTEGLLRNDDHFLESTGHYGSSTIRKVIPETGNPIIRQNLPEDQFAEGIAMAKGKLHLLTWHSGKGYLYDPNTLQRTDSFSIPPRNGSTEAWGLTFDGTDLIMSDGTAVLSRHTPLTFARIGTITIHDDGHPVRLLNELEWIDGRILANVWKSDRIAVIVPETGMVEAWIDLSELRKELRSEAGTANGIAWDATSGRLYVTGKDWEWLFEISVPELGYGIREP